MCSLCDVDKAANKLRLLNDRPETLEEKDTFAFSLRDTIKKLREAIQALPGPAAQGWQAPTTTVSKYVMKRWER